MSVSGQESQIQLLGSCIYNGELYILSIYDSMSLAEMYVELARRWSEMSPQFFTIRYLAPHQKMYVTLNTDDDVSNMVRLHVCLKLTIIDMMVVRKNEPTGVGKQAGHVCG